MEIMWWNIKITNNLILYKIKNFIQISLIDGIFQIMSLN
jgi:hypothetical protein